MATLCHFPAVLSLNKEHQRFKLCWNLQEYPPRKGLSICACSIKKARVGRKVKSNTELCNEIRQFVDAVGLPEGHVPSLKELSQHGRSELANIVRRRGYKLIRELLTNSEERDGIVRDANINVAVMEDKNSLQEDELAGHDEKVSETVEAFSSTEVAISESFSRTPNIDVDKRDGQSRCGPMESSASSDSNEDASFILAGDSHEVENNTNGHLSSQASIASSIKSGVGSLIQEVEGSFNKKMLVEEIKDNVASSSQSTEVSAQEPYSSPTDTGKEPNLNDFSMMMKYSADSTLKEKVADFLRNGNLDTCEDNGYGILYESAAEESKPESDNVHKDQLSTPEEADPKDVLNGMNSVTASDGNLRPSKQAVANAMINHNDRDNQALGEGTSGDNLDMDLDAETMKNNNQAEMNRLKFMLHQKELELTRLKEQIEKEKVALFALQTKAEEEISKAQKLISEKDEELNAAEESLSGLKEVQVEYSGNGEIVELAGSFNGWHHQIKMDRHLNSDVVEHIGSRKKRVWSTSLWLYPGTYEIKFIVDGHWVLDSQRESIHRGAICNNILKVDR